jgi:hypothetical protein
VPKAVTLSVVAVLFAAGVLLSGTIAGGGRAAQRATTVATATTVEDTTTSEAQPTTVVETETVERTTTRIVRVPTTQTTTSTASDTEGTPAWVWALLGILAVGLIVLIVLLARRGGGGGTASVEERALRLEPVIASWTAQGWAIESQTADSAVLRRGAESMVVSVDPTGRVSTRPNASM